MYAPHMLASLATLTSFVLAGLDLYPVGSATIGRYFLEVARPNVGPCRVDSIDWSAMSTERLESFPTH